MDLVSLNYQLLAATPPRVLLATDRVELSNKITISKRVRDALPQEEQSPYRNLSYLLFYLLEMKYEHNSILS